MGIGAGMIRTKGEVVITILNVPIHFQIVKDDFPLKCTGLLGISFLQKQEATFEFKENLLGKLQFGKRESSPYANVPYNLPPRTKTLITAPAKNNNSSGYIRRLDAGLGVFIGECLVTQQNGSVKLYAINTTFDHIVLTIPPIELEEFDSKPPSPRSSQTKNYDSKIDKSKDHARRLAELIKVLDLDHLNEIEKSGMLEVINEFLYQFYLPMDNFGVTDVTQHTITTTDEIPIRTKQYRYPLVHKEETNKQIDSLLNSKIIQPSSSPYNSPVWIVPKKSDSSGKPKWRMVIDYRKLNEVTVSDAYPLPNITEILDQLGGAKYFSTLDLASGFHQIPMDPKSKPKTAFSTPHGHFEFNRMPFGLRNAPATFQRVMDMILTGLQGIELFVYMDDIVIYADSLEEHNRKLKVLLARLQNSGLTLQPQKCRFLQKEKTRKNVKQFLGLVGYYRRFIPNMAKIAKPLTNLLKKGILFRWTSEVQSSFEQLRDIICSEHLLQYPDFSRPFLVTTDASNYAVGAVFSQGQIGNDLSISYASRALNAAEINYSTIEKELLAVLFGIEHFRPYLYGQQFTLITDHRPLVWLHNAKDPTSRLRG